MLSTTGHPLKAVRSHRKELLTRVRVLSATAASILGLIAGGFWFVQIVRGAHYAELAENNRLRQYAIRATRGLIYDRNDNVLVQNIPSYRLLLDRTRSEDVPASLAFAAQVLERPVEELAAEVEDAAPLPVFQPVTVARNLTLAQVAKVAAAGYEHPELEVDVHHLRFYRHGPQTAHVLGYIGQVTERDLATGDYHSGDRVGREGIEQIYDHRLRGTDGERVVVVDSRGRTLREHSSEPAEPGNALRLTLDLPLQQAAERLLRDKVGAVVALDPRDGAVLALVSSPSYDPNAFARGLQPAQWQALLDNPHDPLQNRALDNAYSPGSVFKIVMAAAGLAEGAIDADDAVYCGGSTTIYNHRFHCGRAGGHGWVDLDTALERSCNVYFYHLGQTLGIERIARYARGFGLGERSGIDLAGEKRGLVPDSAWSRERRGTPWYPGETISVAIGQGPLLTTPIQLARLTATVANGGRLVEPHLLAGGGTAGTEATRRVPVPAQLLVPIREGLAAVVASRRGTGYWAAHSERVAIAGKTGTVQVVGRDSGHDRSNLPDELQNHGWFASYAPADDPELVIVVFAEHGASGAGGAAPIARSLHEEFFARPAAAPVSG